MYYTREQHKRFLDKELQAISENYIRVLNTKATALLSENEVYVAQFMKVDLEKDANKDDVFKGSGQVILKFNKDKGIPRKNEYFTALLLDGDKCLPRNWGNLSWAELRKFQVEYSEVHCVWQGKANDNGFLLCGFNGDVYGYGKVFERAESFGVLYRTWTSGTANGILSKSYFFCLKYFCL
jgi:hypothetical protein